ncbi:MAG: hypothetical protein ACE5LU_03085 [Anaerolineae bacterium]
MILRIFIQTCISFVFLVANVIILLAILALNRRGGASSSQTATPAQEGSGENLLDPDLIFEVEFEYAHATAGEAMKDRHTMVNFYLLVVGLVASGVIAVLGRDTDLPKAAATLLLWLVCAVGWLYFLKIIRLRQAWHDSAQAMNQIKEFYIQHASGFEDGGLRSAFRWQAHTLPAPDKPWTVFFYSAVLIGFLDSVAYVAGGMLMDLDAALSLPLLVGGLLVLFGLAFFAFHVWLYFAFLKPEPSPGPASSTPSQDRS